MVSFAVEVDLAGEGVDLRGQRISVGLALGGLGIVDCRHLGTQIGCAAPGEIQRDDGAAVVGAEAARVVILVRAQ